MTSCETSVLLAAALAQCAREPIRTPGSIQPQGFMMVLDDAAERVLQVSDNVRQWLQLEPAQLLETPVAQLFDQGAALSARLAAWGGEEQQPFHFADVRFVDGSRRQLGTAMMVHRIDGVIIAEFEPAADIAHAYGALYPLVRTFISQLHNAQDITELCQRSVAEVKRVTGFGRVKAYSFDAAGNGTVLAEARDDSYPSYLGLCFPASDIPPQARALYCINRIRVIEDAHYEASPLVPAFNPLTGQPLDLSHAALRSVSPVHLQYMRNMQTMASMSISIVVDGQLWGLISCHHDQPHAVGFQTRTACELLGSVLSLQIETKTAHAQNERMLELRR